MPASTGKGSIKKKRYRGEELKKMLGVEKYVDSPIYRTYYAMKNRCYSKNNKAYKYYGGKGIEICEEWLEPVIGFERFAKWSIENGWKEGMTIDRIENDKGYCPENCRWATAKQQLMNRTVSRNFIYNGELKSLSEIARENNINCGNLHVKVYSEGYDIYEAVNYLLYRKSREKDGLRHSKQVAQIDENGTIIKVFPSAKSAGDFYKKSPVNLSSACRNGGKWLGKKWKYITEKEYYNFLENKSQKES